MGATDPKRLAALFILAVITLLVMGAGRSRSALGARALSVLMGLACIGAAVACVVLFVAQGSSSIHQAITLQQHWDEWPKVEATITGGWENHGSRRTIRENGTANEYYPEFEYTVDGQLHEYRGIQSPFTTRHPYPVGSKLLLAYDPRQPDSIVAREEIEQMHDLGVVTTAIAVVVALGLLGFGVHLVRRRDARAGVSPT